MSDRKIIYLDDAIEAICKACSMEEDYHRCDGYPETSTWCDSLVALRALPSAQPERKAEELLPDGTLHLFTDTDLSKVNRVLVSQNGTHYGDLYYADEDFQNCGADMRDVERRIKDA